jgi:hypothetical protein
MCCECDVVDGDVFAICEEITRQSDVSEKAKCQSTPTGHINGHWVIFHTTFTRTQVENQSLQENV